MALPGSGCAVTTSRSAQKNFNFRRLAALQAEMNAKRLVEFGDERRWQLTYSSADPLDCHRAGLLGLRFGVPGQSGLACRQQDLEGVDARDV